MYAFLLIITIKPVFGSMISHVSLSSWYTPGSGEATSAACQWTLRYRVGDYRIVYRVQDNLLTVLVLDDGHRRDIYRDR
jgi:ParE toxin of type II toxin-antitoxin system, parDE